MTSSHQSKAAWEAAISAVSSRANSELGMDLDEAQAYALKKVGPWVEPDSPVAVATPNQTIEPVLDTLAADRTASSDAVQHADAENHTKAPTTKDAGKSSAGKPDPDQQTRRETKDGGAAIAGASETGVDTLPKSSAQANIEATEQPTVVKSGAPALIWALGGVAIAFAYCFAEISYNMSLVEFVSSANTSSDAFANLERVGKSLGAIGLSMVAARAFFKEWRAIAAFAVMAPLAYMAIDHGFDAYVDGLSHEAKVEGYYLGAYRSLTLNGQLVDLDFAGPEGSIERKLKLLNLPLAAGSGKNPQRKVTEYVLGNDEAKNFDKEINDLFEVYNDVSRKIDPLFGYYYIESKKVPDGMFHDKYVAAFMKKTGGIPPGLDKDAFNAQIQKSYPSLAIYRATVAIPAQPSIGMAALRMGDIPPGLDQPSFQAFFKDFINKARTTRREKANEVETLAHAKNLISSSFVPPLSMSLSMLSFGLNGAAAIAGLLLLGLWPWRAQKWHKAASIATRAGLTAAVVIWMATRPMALTGPAGNWQAQASERSFAGMVWSRAINAEAAVLAMAAPALPAIHGAFIDDTHPDHVNKVRVERASTVDLGDLDQKLDEFKASADQQPAPQIADPNFCADEKRLKEKGYYGSSCPPGGTAYGKK